MANDALRPAAGIDKPPFVTMDFAERYAGPPTTAANFETSVAAAGSDGG
jgi:hypothetical protein